MTWLFAAVRSLTAAEVISARPMSPSSAGGSPQSALGSAPPPRASTRTACSSPPAFPSSDHGVTTVVTGNCGVGFAPCRPEDRAGLVALMAGVEDIPEVVMTEGLDWSWTSFPDYLDVVEGRPHDIDIAAMLPHSALRVYVMGQRAIRRENAAPEDIARMADLTREAIAAGAIGFGPSRALQQRSIHGEPIPTVRAAEDELRGILAAMGAGVFQLLSDFDEFTGVDSEFAMFRRLMADTGRPMSFTLNQKHSDPDGWGGA